MSDERWRDDSIQFPRLLAEINATQELDYEALMESMDLEYEEVDELFERAHDAWERAKRNIEPLGWRGSEAGP